MLQALMVQLHGWIYQCGCRLCFYFIQLPFDKLLPSQCFSVDYKFGYHVKKIATSGILQQHKLYSRSFVHSLVYDHSVRWDGYAVGRRANHLLAGLRTTGSSACLRAGGMLSCSVATEPVVYISW